MGVPSRGSKEHRKLVSTTVLNHEQEADFLKASELLVQCEWVKWTSYVQNNLRWKDILGMPSNILQFCLGATYNVLPSASNLVRWRQTSDSSCPLCHKSIGTIIHSLTCCPIALEQGRVTFRHDSVLNRIISKIKVVINSIRAKGKIKLPTLEFVPAGSNKKSSKGKDPSFGLLHFTLDWKIPFDPRYSQDQSCIRWGHYETHLQTQGHSKPQGIIILWALLGLCCTFKFHLA